MNVGLGIVQKLKKIATTLMSLVNKGQWCSLALMVFAPLFDPSGAALAQTSGESRSANARVNDSIVYHGKIVNPAGTPIEGSVAVRIKIFSPEPSVCLLWSEQQVVKAKNGGFSMELGYAENRIAGPNGGVAADFRSVFINNPGLNHASASCVVGSSYTPSKNDDRLMSAEFVDNGVSVAVEKIPIKSVPFAKQASEVGGFGISNLFKISGAGSEEQFSPEEVSRLKAVSASGSANQVLGVSGTGGVVEYKSITAGTGIAVTHTSSGIQISSTGGGGIGTVTSVGVSGLPLSVSSATSTPMISIAQANSSQAGYLSAADWLAFNNKQPAGAYLTSITGAQVTSALGYTPQAAGSYLTGIAGSDVLSALGYTPQQHLGYTPVNKSGDSMTGSLSLPSNGLAVGANQLVVSGNNVGIGTSSPGYKLEVSGASRFTGDVLFNSDSLKTDIPSADPRIYGTAGKALILGADNAMSLKIETDGTLNLNGSNQKLAMGSVNVISRNITTGDVSFATNANGNFTFLPSGLGNVGIGTTSPGDLLHVAGKIRAQEICDTSGGNCKVISSGWTAGSVTSVGVSGLPLSVANATSTPTISIAQANGSQAGFLSAADWTAFNNKQPAGAYLTGITGAQVSAALGFTPQPAGSYLSSISGSDVNSALGYTPVSNTLPANQTYIGNGSNLAAAGFFGVGNLRNSSGTAQFPSSCAASQTLTWSAITDVFSCTNIGSLPASAISSGTIDSARLPFGASLWQDGGSSRIYYNAGNVGIGTASPGNKLHIATAASGDPALSSKYSSAFVLSPTAVNTIFEMDWNSANHFYLQAKHKVSATGMPLLLNPTGGNVGVGTGSTAPGATLHVMAANSPGLLLERGGAANATMEYKTTTGSVFVGQGNSGGFAVGTSADLASSSLMTVSSSGFLGVGTVTPARILDLAASSNAEVILRDGAQAANSRAFRIKNTSQVLGFESVSDNLGAFTSGLYLTRNGAVGIGQSSPFGAKLDVNGSVHIGASYSGAVNAPTNGLLVEGNVGIGTSSPSSKLDVAGTVTATSFSGAGTGLTGTAASLTAGAASAVAWSGITSKPTTIAGYSISDAVATSRTISTGTGLLGGGDLSANRTLSVDVGVGASKIPQMDSAGRYPPASGFVATTKDDITARTDSGYYQTANATTATGWPVTTNSWYHLMTSTHTNDANYYSMQFAADFFNNNNLYYRSTNGNGATAWNKVVTANSSGNVGVGVSNPAARLDVAGEVKFGNTSSTCNSTTEGQQRYNSGSKKMEFCNGTAWTEFGSSGGSSGAVLQMKYAEVVGPVSGSAAIPLDNTIPQQSEGSEFMSVSITPTNASNKLRIVVQIGAITETSNHSDGIIGAIFRDSTADAIGVGIFGGTYYVSPYGMNTVGSGVVVAEVTAGSTSATTFKFRAGCNGGAAALNQTTYTLGGLIKSSITVYEVAP